MVRYVVCLTSYCVDYKSNDEEEEKRVGNVALSSKHLVNIRIGQFQNQSQDIVPYSLGEVRIKNLSIVRSQNGEENNDNSDNEKESDETHNLDTDFSSIHGSGDKEKKTIVFNPKDVWNPTLACSMKFSSFKEFKDTICKNDKNGLKRYVQL